MAEVEVLIAGGGPAGSTLALALADSGLAVSLVEPRAAPDPSFRPVALSHGSRLVLEGLGLFGRFPTTPIETIHVSQAGSFGRTLIRREEHGVEALGYVCALADLAAALAQASAPQRVTGRVTAWRGNHDAVAVSVEDGGVEREISARLLVLADGGRGEPSGARQLITRDYQQAAIVALVRTEAVQPRTAWERFTEEGPLALLPFEQAQGEQPDRRHALIWTVPAPRAHAIADAPEKAFLAALGERFGQRLGRFTATGPRSTHPLALRYRRSSVAGARVIAIGNAAQMLHPVAGQALNLGLRDAFELAQLLRDSAPAAIGAEAMLQRYAALRRIDRNLTIGITDALVRVFAVTLPGARVARGLGLAALDILPPAKRFFARRMMLGLRGVP